MRSLVIDPARARFPARCVGCGAAPERDVTLESFRGIDLLYFRWGHRCQIALPVCRRCWGQRWRRRVGWLAGIIGGIVALIALAAVIATSDTWSAPFAAGFLVSMLLPAIYLLRKRELELFQRVASPVWLRNWRPKQNCVELRFTDEKLAEDVAVLSGLSAPPMREAHYREPAVAPAPPMWSGPRARSLPWWVALIFGGVFWAVAVVEFIQYSQLERTGESFSDEMIFVWIYELGGKYLLSGILVAFGIFFIAGGFVLRSVLKNNRPR
jgi:multisubunit Na+/H+ antiporter MnhB subunit